MKFNENSFEDHINSLLKNATKLSSYLSISKYFKSVKNVQNSYMVELRRIYVSKLNKEGLSNCDLARLMCKDHATISYLMRTVNEEDPIRKEVLPYYEQWVRDKVYPETYTVSVPSAGYKQGYKSIVKYKLKSINDGENINRQNSSTNTRIKKMERI